MVAHGAGEDKGSEDPKEITPDVLKKLFPREHQSMNLELFNKAYQSAVLAWVEKVQKNKSYKIRNLERDLEIFRMRYVGGREYSAISGEIDFEKLGFPRMSPKVMSMKLHRNGGFHDLLMHHYRTLTQGGDLGVSISSSGEFDRYPPVSAAYARSIRARAAKVMNVREFDELSLEPNTYVDVDALRSALDSVSKELEKKSRRDGKTREWVVFAEVVAPSESEKPLSLEWLAAMLGINEKQVKSSLTEIRNSVAREYAYHAWRNKNMREEKGGTTER